MAATKSAHPAPAATAALPNAGKGGAHQIMIKGKAAEQSNSSTASILPVAAVASPFASSTAGAAQAVTSGREVNDRSLWEPVSRPASTSHRHSAVSNVFLGMKPLPAPTSAKRSTPATPKLKVALEPTPALSAALSRSAATEPPSHAALAASCAPQTTAARSTVVPHGVAPSLAPTVGGGTAPAARTDVKSTAAPAALANDRIERDEEVVAELMTVGVIPSDIQLAPPPHRGKIVFVLNESHDLLTTRGLRSYSLKEMGVQGGIEIKFWSAAEAARLDQADIKAAGNAPAVSTAPTRQLNRRTQNVDAPVPRPVIAH